MSKKLPSFTPAHGLGPFPEMVEQHAGWESVVKLFKGHGLPLNILDNRDARIPMTSLVDVMESGGRLLSDRTLGLRTGERMTYRDFGNWGRYCGAAETLGEALQRAIDTIWCFQSLSRMSTGMEGSHLVFRYHNALHLHRRGRQHSDHIIFPLISLVRVYLGPGWKPDWIEVDYTKDRGAGEIEVALGREVRFGRDAVGIAIPRKLIGQARLEPLAPHERIALSDLLFSRARSRDLGPLKHIEEVIALRLLDGAVDIEGAAFMLNISVRSLQRILRGEGISYRSLIERARFKRALALLRGSHYSVTDIAHSLGYMEAGNFTRAFYRIAGQTPTDFRKTNWQICCPRPVS